MAYSPTADRGLPPARKADPSILIDIIWVSWLGDTTRAPPPAKFGMCGNTPVLRYGGHYASGRQNSYIAWRSRARVKCGGSFCPTIVAAYQLDNLVLNFLPRHGYILWLGVILDL